MTRVSENIEVPTAWIFTQFAVANIASAILVSSNPTNLVLAGAFGIRFLNYTANIIIPVVVTAIVLFPFLMYVVFRDDAMIPSSIKLHELSDAAKARLQTRPVNPNIPNSKGAAEVLESDDTTKAGQAMSLEEILHPFLDKTGAIVSSVIMAATLVCILALNASASSTHEYPVYWVTLPASAVSFGYDLASGWVRRKQTREIARKGLSEVEEAKARAVVDAELRVAIDSNGNAAEEKHEEPVNAVLTPEPQVAEKLQSIDYERMVQQVLTEMRKPQPKTLQSRLQDSWRWCRETFPTASAVLTLLPLPLVPFAFCMFVLVQALVTKGWVPVFAHGWNAWVKRTGTVGGIAGMGFLGTVLSNVSRLGDKCLDV
jgi:Na+/H+ antiporter NhaD/arsenite permease-like protein